jgi:flagellar motor switch protein FliN/FliY
MAIQDDLRAREDVAAAFIAALSEQWGPDDDGPAPGEVQDTLTGVLDDDAAGRVVACTFTADDGWAGTIAFVASGALAERLERSAADETLLTACTPALEQAVQALSNLAEAELGTDAPHDIELATLTDEIASHEVVVYPLIAGDTTVAALAVTITQVDVSDGAVPDYDDERSPFGETAPRVLADVEMGVTAELGRCQMSVRELLSITPGAVIDLDRAAGAPVDVLVNGTLIARGEVVIIEEEFGIRISEILANS